MEKRKIDENVVFEAALDEFIAKSFDEASLNTIIKNANISKGSFYYRYENKYALYLHIIKTCNRKKWDYIRGLIEENHERKISKNIFDQFISQALMGIKFAHRYPKYHLLSKTFSKEKGTKLYKDVIHDLGNSDEAGLKDMIRQAIINNNFNKRFSEEFLIKIINFLFSSFDEIFFSDSQFELEEAYKNLEDYIEFMRNGLV